MDKRYLVLVNGLLWKRKRTRLGAVNLVSELLAKGLKASWAYEAYPERVI
jgi:hypothetical protein